MRRILLIMLLTWSNIVSATTYYVSSSAGSDANNGSSMSTAWQTIAHVNAQTFQPGDSVLFRRGDVWNESLAPGSSGSSGNPITFDAYGAGAAPNLTGYYAVPATTWVLVTGNAWKAPLPATYTTINFCLFGSVWGQKVAASSSNLTAQWDFYLANGYVYVYSVGSPATYYNEPIVPMALSNVPVININGKSWLTFQHFLLNWFDQYGVYVQGASDHLVFANMEADSMIPQGTQPLGFYVNESAPGPGDIKIYNSEAHLNYDGFRFDGTATAISMVNDKAYGNRDGALVDNTGAAVYSYCHFYASSLAVAGSTDVEWTSGVGPTAGAGNIAPDTAPGVQVWQRYPAQVTLTVDDAGMTAGADTYYANTVLPVADAAGVPVGAAVTVGYPLAQTLISEFQGWVNAGRDVTSHSISHTYYTNTDALEIQYTGSGTAATLSNSNKTLTITVTGASDSVSYNLAQGQAQGTIKALRLALLATGKFTATEIQTCQGPYGTGCSAYTESALLAQDLADVSGQDVRSSVYHMQLDVTRLTTDEITLSRQWMTTNLTGLPTTPVYVYPGGYETTTMQGITAGVPYTGARGALKEDLGVKDTYASGFDVQNITSFGVNPSWQGLQPAALNQKIQALVWKEVVWGVPWGIFWHVNELTNNDPVGGAEITNLIQDFKNSGATIQTNTGLVNWLLSGTQETGTDGNYYYKFPATSMTLDFRPTKNSPVVDVGQNLGATYALDINGVNQNSYGRGWEIGAHVYQGYATYGEATGPGAFAIGLGQNGSAMATLPQVWVNNHEGDALVSYELSLPGTWVGAVPPGCTFNAPYWTGSPTNSGLQNAINDIEACRTATGVGLKLDIPPALYTSANGLVIPQSSNTPATNFLILNSTQDANLPNGRTVCSHGMQDNLATSTDIGLDNPDCAGDAMYYQLGNTITNVPAGPITLANGTATNTSAYNDVQSMWTVETSGANQTALQTCSPVGTGGIPAQCVSSALAPDHWLIEDMEARMSSPNTSNDTIVSLTDSGAESSTGQLPTHIHFRKVWLHGDWASLATGSNVVTNGLSFGCFNCSLVDSQISQVLRPGAEGHSIGARLGSQFKIDHNWLEGSSSGFFCGGFTQAPQIAGLVPCNDVEIRRNRFTFPYAWLGVTDSTCGTHGVGAVPHTNPNWGCTSSSGNSLVRKNVQEFKMAERVVLDGNIFENSDTSGGQSGVLHDLNVRNNSGSFGSGSNNYQATINDITESNNIWRNGCEWAEMGGSETTGGSGNGVSFLPKRISFVNELIYGITTTNPGCASANSTGLSPQSALNQWQGTVTENASGTAATFVGNCAVAAGSRAIGGCPGQVASLAVGSAGTGCVAGSLVFSAPTITGGEQAAGTNTCSGGALGTVTLTNAGSGYSTAATASLATGTGTVTVTMINSPVTPLVGVQYHDRTAGDPIDITMCPNVTAFNLPTSTYGSGFVLPSGIGPLAAAGTNPSSLTVTFPWSATPNASDTSGFCTMTTTQGGPENLTLSHVTLVTDSIHTITSANGFSAWPNRGTNNILRDSIMLGGGWFNNPLGEGTPSEKYNYDVTTLLANHMVWPTRTASNYTEYGPGCTAGCSPPVTMYFPATPYCTGATPTSGCVGFVGAMSASSMPLTLPDYHGYALMAGSVFRAGGSGQASDGADMAANIPAIDAGQTQTTYRCNGRCGTPGPFSD